MNETPRFPTAEDIEKERGKEVELFGKPVETGSILEEIYAYLYLEDIEQIQIDFDLRATEFNSVENQAQWASLSPHLSKLRGYKAKRDSLGADVEKIRELKLETKVIIETIKKVLRSM